jgi:hypothetical protein
MADDEKKVDGIESDAFGAKAFDALERDIQEVFSLVNSQ